jgi:[acyl-carrier-protein] S-malonyltransferase
MVSLSRDNLEWFQQKLRRGGGMSLYTMHPPMHVSSFGPLREKIRTEVFDRLTFADPTLPVVNDQNGEIVSTGEQVRDMLLDGIVNTVRWPDAVATLKRLGVTKVHIAGQDSLFGRVAVTTKNFEVAAVDPKLAVSPRKRTAA